jgi:hypothetical protein
MVGICDRENKSDNAFPVQWEARPSSIPCSTGCYFIVLLVDNEIKNVHNVDMCGSQFTLCRILSVIKSRRLRGPGILPGGAYTCNSLL